MKGKQMGWRTDWLYRLIFEKVEEAWRQAKKEAMRCIGGPHIMPDYILVRECARFSKPEAMCLLPVLREWKFNGSTFELIPTQQAEQRPIPYAIRGIFFSTGVVKFHIMPGREEIGYNLLLGPRYGRGHVFIVRGQGKQGYLSRSDKGAGWVS